MNFSDDRQRSDEASSSHRTVETLVERKRRLVGLDLFRGISAYAVVLYHSGDKTWGDIGTGAVFLRDMFGFAVPFFLATSFVFLTQTVVISRNDDISLRALVSKRLKRIAKPYVLWSLVFLIFRGAFFVATNELNRLHRLLSDPLSVVFFGGASYQLYFLPLLLTGNIVYIALKSAYIQRNKKGVATKKLSVFSTLLLLALSIGIREVIVTSGNDFDLGSYAAFQNLAAIKDIHQEPLVRLALVFLAWCSRCLPYIFGAIAFNQLFLKQDKTYNVRSSKWMLLLATILFLITSYFDGHLYFRSVENLVIAYSLIFIGFSLPDRLWKSQQVKLIQNMGSCAIGIYLVHPIVIRCATFLMGAAYPDFIRQITVLSILSISLFSFVSSWLIVSQLEKHVRLFS